MKWWPKIIENLIRFYILAFANNKLRANQKHIGERCAILSASLIKTALNAAIKEACGISTNIQHTAQKNYIDAVKLIKDFGFTCTVPNDIATSYWGHTQKSYLGTCLFYKLNWEDG